MQEHRQDVYKRQFTAQMAGQTMDGEILDGRYYSNYVLCKNDIYVNLTYHYYDEGLIMHGWDSTPVSYTHLPFQSCSH